VLTWAVLLLVAGLAALSLDLWMSSPPDGLVVQAFDGEPALPDSEPPGVTPSASAIPATSTHPPPSTPTAEVSLPSPVTPPPCVPPDDWGIHVVQQGNTLYSTARRYGTDVETLMQVNCLNTSTIFVGQQLYVPGALTVPSVPTLAANPTPIPTVTPRPGASATPPIDQPAAAVAVPAAPQQSVSRSAAGAQVPGDYLNIVLLGSDRRPNSGAWRTDSMIVVSVDKEYNIVRLLSIPRDLWVNIPGYGNNRINTADLWGELAKKGSGPERVKQTIYQNLGIPIHYYVRVNFGGFIKIIDAVGGVNVDVDCALPDINLSAGIHHMGGQQALRYARSRKSTNDFDRARRQRKVLMALWDQALSLDIIPRLPQLWRTMDDAFQTDLPLQQVINLAYVGVQLKPQHIVSRAITSEHTQSWTTPQGWAVLLPRQDKIRTLLDSFFAPVDPNRLDTVDKVRVRVLNGSQRSQAAELATATLGWNGFRVVEYGQADSQINGPTQILVLTGNATAAQRAASQLRVPATAVRDLTSSQGQPDPAEPVDLQIILGPDYNPCQRY
jgi:LCP family protein required for cell wall assembly